MVQQAQPNYFQLQPGHRGASSVAPARSVRLGPLQRLKMALGFSYIRQGAPLRIPPKPLWFEKGWRKAADANSYTGQYKVAGRSFRGLIQQPYPKSYAAYIWHPPMAELKRNTNHWPCFSQSGEAGRFQVHYYALPSCLDHAIKSIEDVLAEAYNRRR